MSFAPYAVAYLALISGIVYLASRMQLPVPGILVLVLLLLGLGMLSGAGVMRHEDPK